MDCSELFEASDYEIPHSFTLQAEIDAEAPANDVSDTEQVSVGENQELESQDSAHTMIQATESKDDEDGTEPVELDLLQEKQQMFRALLQRICTVQQLVRDCNKQLDELHVTLGVNHSLVDLANLQSLDDSVTRNTCQVLQQKIMVVVEQLDHQEQVLASLHDQRKIAEQWLLLHGCQPPVAMWEIFN